MTLSDLTYHQKLYSMRQNMALYLAIGAIILSVLFPPIAFPVTYVLGIFGAITLMSYSSFAFYIAIRKSFNRYKTSGLVRYKISTLLASFMWMMLNIILAMTAFVLIPIPISSITFAICIYLESEITISDNEVYPVKVGSK